MAQDIRKMMRDFEPEEPNLPKGHEARFEALLNKNFGTENKRKSFSWIKVAAIGIVFLGLSIFGYYTLSDKTNNENMLVETDNSQTNSENIKQIRLGDISPDLKKVEDFYLTGINVQLASLPINPENKDLIDGYMERLGELDKEYILLNKELNEVGPTEAAITALIENLKLRLDLLFKLKNKLKELKNQNDEQIKSIEA
jgi:hypothetical protein